MYKYYILLIYKGPRDPLPRAAYSQGTHSLGRMINKGPPP